MALLDFLGLGGGSSTGLDPYEYGPEIGMLDRATLNRMRRAGAQRVGAIDMSPATPPAAGYGGGRGFDPRWRIAAGSNPQMPGSVINNPPGAFDPWTMGPDVLTSPAHAGLPQMPNLWGGQGTPNPAGVGVGDTTLLTPPADQGSQGGGVAPPLPPPQEVPGLTVSLPQEPPAALENKPPPLGSGGGGPVTPSTPPQNLLARIDDFLGRHSNKFLGLAAGFGGARSIGQGISRAATGLATGAKEDRVQQAQNMTANVLQQRYGYSKEEADAISQNPEMLKQVLPSVYGQPEFKVVTDSAGNQRLVLINPVAGTATTPRRGAPPGTIGTYQGGKAILGADGKWHQYTD